MAQRSVGYEDAGAVRGWCSAVGVRCVWRAGWPVQLAMRSSEWVLETWVSRSPLAGRAGVVNLQ